MYYYEAWEKYAKLHEAHCIEFVEELAIRGEEANLVQEPALSEAGFIDFLRTENGSSDAE